VLVPQPRAGTQQDGGQGIEAPASSVHSASTGATRKPRVADLLERIAELEKNLELARVTETTQVYGCTDLENNQRLLKELKDDARKTVKSLLIHPKQCKCSNGAAAFQIRPTGPTYTQPAQQHQTVACKREHTLGKLVAFATHVSNLKALLQSTKAEQHLVNPTLMYELVAKLPISKRLDWVWHAAAIQPYPTIVDFSSWLRDLANVVCVVTDIDVKEPRHRLLHASIDRVLVEEQEICLSSCPMCEGRGPGQHVIWDCQRFLGVTFTERSRLVRRQGATKSS